MTVKIFNKLAILFGLLISVLMLLSGNMNDQTRINEKGTPSLATKQVVAKIPKFSALVLAEDGGHHIEYSKVARTWLDKLADDSNFAIDHIITTDSINNDYLKKYQLFIQLDYPPYAWKDKAVRAFEKYIAQGKGGWIGFHHATLLGEFDGYPMWKWFFHLWAILGSKTISQGLQRVM